MTPQRLPPSALMRRCDLQAARSVPAPDGPFWGQERALTALDFGLAMPGYHIFVQGPPHTGRLTAALQRAEHAAQAWPTPPDWYYVNAPEGQRHFGARSAPPSAGAIAGVRPMASHQPGAPAPVIVATQPTRRRLVGCLRWRLHEASLQADLHDIQPGLLHQANGGVLIVRLDDLLSYTGALETLLHALRTRQIHPDVDSPAGWPALAPGFTCDPIPLDLTVILIGDAYDYAWLAATEPDFARVFRAKAEFSDTMRRTPENEALYIAFSERLVQQERLLKADKHVMSGLIEYGSWLAADQRKLSAQFAPLADRLREASYFARRAGHKTITRADWVTALEAHTARHNLAEQEALERILDGQVRLETAGEAIGQVNALVVVDDIDYPYALPAQLTARVYLGREGIMHLDYESHMTGPFHDKGLRTLIGYLGGHFAQDYPLSLAASLAFEQNYAEIDGDSASCAELFALLSALGRLPARQSIAVTGSVNQMGRVQPIGDVTRKIEGFFKVCQLHGLTGDQGVIIPRANAPELMLKPDVIAAVEAEQFHIYAMDTADEGIALLTGCTPEDVHAAVDKRLRDLALRIENFSSEAREDHDEDDEHDDDEADATDETV